MPKNTGVAFFLPSGLEGLAEGVCPSTATKNVPLAHICWLPAAAPQNLFSDRLAHQQRLPQSEHDCHCVWHAIATRLPHDCHCKLSSNCACPRAGGKKHEYTYHICASACEQCRNIWKLPVAIVWQSCGSRVAIAWQSRSNRVATKAWATAGASLEITSRLTLARTSGRGFLALA